MAVVVKTNEPRLGAAGRALRTQLRAPPMGYHFGVGAPPVLLYFGGDWDVHWRITGILTLAVSLWAPYEDSCPPLETFRKSPKEGRWQWVSAFKIGAKGLLFQS